MPMTDTVERGTGGQQASGSRKVWQVNHLGASHAPKRDQAASAAVVKLSPQPHSSDKSMILSEKHRNTRETCPLACPQLRLGLNLF